MSDIVLWIQKANKQNVVFPVLGPMEKEDDVSVLHHNDLAQIQKIPQELVEVRVVDWKVLSRHMVLEIGSALFS